MNKITEVQKAYIAGFIDGEGCINISKYQGKNNKTPVYSLSLVVTQTRNNTLHQLQDIAGVGTIHERKSPHGSAYTWRVPAREASEFLAELLPYLRNKRKEAELAIKYQSSMSHTACKRGYVVPASEIERREKIRTELSNLKGFSAKRGRPVKRVE